MALHYHNKLGIEIRLILICFEKQEIDSDLFIGILNEFGKTQTTQSSKNILITDINGLKVDFANYKYPLFAEPSEIDGVRMLSKKDISAMKLNAIAGRGSKKDFIDLYFLMEEFSIKEMLDFYNEKYFDGSEFMVVKGLSYFEEANVQPQPQMFKYFEWEICKQKIIEEVLKL